MIKSIVNHCRQIAIFFIICFLCTANVFANSSAILALAAADTNIDGRSKVIVDPVIAEYIQSLGQRLMAASDDPTTPIRMFALSNSVINAYTIPGNTILVNSGLILLARSESELAAVVAHEMGHVIQRHLLRSEEQSKLAVIPAVLAALAAIAVGVVNPTAGMGALTATMAGYAQNRINFTRENEREADRVGMEMLHKAGFDPYGMANVFRLIQQVSNYLPYDIPQYLRTHPVSEARIADAENRASLYPKKLYDANLANAFLFFRLIRARVRVETSHNMANTIEYFRKQLAVDYGSSKIADRYGYALTLLSMKQFQEAVRQTQLLIQANPNQSLYAMLSAHIQTAKHHFQKALQILQDAIDLEPDYYPLIVQYSKAMIDNGKKLSLARSYLQTQIQNYPHKPMLYYLLAKAQAKARLYALSHLTIAKLLQLTGNARAAIEQLNIAARFAKKDRNVRAAIKAKLKELRKKMKSQ